MLPVPIHENNKFATGGACTAFNRRPIALRVRMGQHPHASIGADLCGGIYRAIVDDDDFGVRIQTLQLRQYQGKPLLFVFRRNYDADILHFTIT